MKRLSACFLGYCLLVAPVSLWADELINCLLGSGTIGGDRISRGFYVPNYPGFTLDQVYLFFNSFDETGEGIFQLTARSESYDGDIIGVAEASYTFSGNGQPVPIVFDFGRAIVENGQIVTFIITQSSGPEIFYSRLNVTEGCPIIQTAGTAPPLSVVNGNSEGVTAIITGASQQPVPSMALLENPGDGSDVSGVTSISGWVCDAERVEVEIDEDILVEAAYGTPRADTMDACGDSDNGFGILVNFGILDDGPHDIRLLADGIEVDFATFNVTTLGTPFVSGLSGTFDLFGFPEGGDQITIEWVQSLQGFVITDFIPSP